MVNMLKSTMKSILIKDWKGKGPGRGLLLYACGAKRYQLPSRLRPR